MDQAATVQTVLTLTGELEDAEAVRTAIRDASDGFSRSLGVDLTGVTYLPSAVIGVLFGSMMNAKQAGTSLVVAVEAGSFAQRVLRIAAMPHVVV